MNYEPRKPKSLSRWTAEHDAVVQHLAHAARRAREANTSATQEELRAAVDAARDIGVGWTKIGDTLGIASGNAYRRYRRRTMGHDTESRCDAGGPHC